MSADFSAVREMYGELAGERRWVCWQYQTRKGKPTKIPIQVSGRNAKSNDPRTWTVLDRCIAYANATPGVGVGIMFNGDGLIGIDLDKCIDPDAGELDSAAQEIVTDLASYAEITPSGCGLHILCRGQLPGGGTGTKRGNVEIYATTRFFAVTGKHWPGTPTEFVDSQEALERLWVKVADEPTRAVDDDQASSAAYQAGDEPDTPWRKLNTLALARLGTWVPELFEDARFVRSKGGYRITAAALGRDLEEDLAIMPHGIRDWAMGDLGPTGDDYGRRGKRTPIDIVMEFGGAADELDAAGWLAERIGQKLADLGFDYEPRPRRAQEERERRAEPENEAPPERPTIQLAGGNLHTEVESAEVALGRAGGVFQRGSVLVRVAQVADPTSGVIRRSAGSTIITPFDRATLRVALTEAIRFERFDRRSEEWVPVNCPADVADAVLASIGRWPTIPPLLGIVEAPTLRPDGSVLEKPGYDAESGLFFASGGVAFPSVSENPTEDQAREALEVLRWPFAEIPFKAEADRSVTLSYALTALTRRSLRAAPGFGFTAPKMGSGKTLSATVVSYIASGRAPAMMSQADDAESERKRLFAVLLEGAPVAVIDNVERAFASDVLCSILTEPVFKDRVLGVSRTASAPTCTTWAVTGNNLTVQGDLTTRMLMSRIDPEVERPEEREFAHDLHVEVPKRRAELAIAALTIIRAYLAAGSPRPKVPTFGRFEQWQEWCRFPLIWLGLADPCETRAAVEGRDPVRERLAELAIAWVAVFDRDELTLAEAMKEALKEPPIVPTPEGDARGRLRAAMAEVAGEGSGLNLRKLGWFLAKHDGRIEAGHRFVRGENRRAGALWRVQAASEGAGFSSFAGFQQPPTRECQTSYNDTYIEIAAGNPQKKHNPQAAGAEIDL